MSMTALIILSAIVLLSCTILKRVSARIGVPTLLLFILLGMVFGSDGLVNIPFDDYAFAEKLSMVALAIIMFYGGFGTSWKAAKPVAVVSIVLSSLGTIATAAIVGLFCYAVLGMPLLEGMLCGALLSSTDAASVFSILRSRNLALKENTDSLLEVESGSNDPFAYMLCVVLLAAMQAGITPGEVSLLLIKQLAFGLVFGFGIGFLARWVLAKAPFDCAESESVFAVAVALFGYGLPMLVDGNGLLSVYIVGIVLGNSTLPDKRTLVPFSMASPASCRQCSFSCWGCSRFHRTCSMCSHQRWPSPFFSPLSRVRWQPFCSWRHSAEAWRAECSYPSPGYAVPRPSCSPSWP